MYGIRVRDSQLWVVEIGRFGYELGFKPKVFKDFETASRWVKHVTDGEVVKL